MGVSSLDLRKLARGVRSPPRSAPSWLARTEGTSCRFSTRFAGNRSGELNRALTRAVLVSLTMSKRAPQACCDHGPLADRISCVSFFVARMTWRNCLRIANFSAVKKPVFRAFLLPRGAPEPAAPPCMRHLFFPRTAGDAQGVPLRVLAPQRGLERIGPVLRGCSLAIGVVLDLQNRHGFGLLISLGEDGHRHSSCLRDRWNQSWRLGLGQSQLFFLAG
jgi:hypothetical protein